jgi:FixJ family two-component response regulator
MAVSTFPVPRTTPVVYVVDGDISVHELLELLIQFEGWHAQPFASAEEFLSSAHFMFRAVSCSTSRCRN